MSMFQKILIANRGEIACRIMKTAGLMGIRSVAVYSDADVEALHVQTADEAHRIGPPPVAESYLQAEKIIEACLASGAEAVHPGYGFLSENPDFVDAIEAAGLVFIGPSSAAIRAMGLKDAAKALMERSGVPIVPGYHGDDQDPDQLQQQADTIGYPVLIKARAGGGGKGMRRVDDPADFKAALESAAREAEASFGDGRCLIEKYITKPRHIEIQVFGDRHGNVVHLFERDCSLQRRHQKVIEEAPAPGMSAEMRQVMGEAAVRAAKAIDYTGAGTIEFIADVSDGLRADRFYFMEMNTRLQVEHPVTEMITGQDLVEWQIRVAAGDRLPLSQDDLGIDGWAIEARLYAEDVGKGFLPATGRLDYLDFPGDDARLDHGIRQGDHVTPFYDPMIAKLIVHGKSRAEALNRIANALAKSRIGGVVTNVGFLKELVTYADVVDGLVDTGLIERYLDEHGGKRTPPDEAQALAALASIGLLPSMDKEATSSSLIDPWDRQDGWRLWDKATETVVLDFEGSITEIEITVEGASVFSITIAGKRLDISHVTANGSDVSCQIGGAKYSACILRKGDIITIFVDGQSFYWTIPNPLQMIADSDIGGDSLGAPMPGLVKLVHVEDGQAVTKDMPLLVMEAMKMEQTLKAPRDGIVERCLVAQGDQVEEGALLLQLRPIEEAA